ncbi:hypothetical protein V1514DRAFT_369451 [Lipomyces japonicus]|uniref:uncharacterized protein n=1 Tax=Lipomyces japonicus TaxID=56871 RepID=UPI0034CDBA26
MAAPLSVEQQLEQLNAAKGLVLQDATFYPRVIRGILPIARRQDPQLRLWCANFLADGFSSQEVRGSEKEALALECLDTVYIMFDDADPKILKNLIQCAASLYPLVFKHVCADREDSQAWNQISSIKSRILQLWDSSTVGVQLASIKFVQRVVSVQTPGTKDPRLADENDVSLTLVPMNHKVLTIPVLEAEAQGVLDRLLTVFYDENINETTVTATIATCGVLIKTRSTISSKILNRILSFNPLNAKYKSADYYRIRLEVRYIEKSLRILLGNLLKISSIQNQFGSRIQQYLTQLVQAKSLTVDELVRKRTVSEPANNDSAIKKQRTEVISDANALSYSTLFTLIDSNLPIAQFDVQRLSADIIADIALAGVAAVDINRLKAAIDIVRKRYIAVHARPKIIKLQENEQILKAVSIPLASLVATQARVEEEEDDDYEPDYEYEPTIEPTTNYAATSSLTQDRQVDDQGYSEDEGDDYIEASIDGGKLTLPATKILTTEERYVFFQEVVERIFNISQVFETTYFTDPKSNSGKDIGEVRNVPNGGDIWIVLLSRLSTRGLPDLVENEDKEGTTESVNQKMIQIIREKLFAYIMEDFKSRVDAAVIWLSEEWYSDKLRVQASASSENESVEESDIKPTSQYIFWTTKILDGIIPFLDANDKVFLRFLSDLPELTPSMILKLRSLCTDPVRAKLGLLSVKYLMKLRPPVKKYCEQLLESLKANDNN